VTFVSTQHEVVRTLPHVSQRSQNQILLNPAESINLSFAIDVGQTSNVDPDMHTLIWPDPLATSAPFHAGYLFSLSVVAATGSILVRLLGAPAGPEGADRTGIEGEWFVQQDTPLSCRDLPLNFSLYNLAISNQGAVIATGVFWQYHIRA